MPVLFFEGVDGSGKNSLISSLYNHYIDLGKDVRIFNDGYGLKYIDDYKTLIKKSGISNKARFLLFQSIRADLYQTILDYHDKNPCAIILVNRSIISSLVYQCLANYDYTYVDAKDSFLEFGSNSINQQFFKNKKIQTNNYNINKLSNIIDDTLPHGFINRTWPIVVYMRCNINNSIERDKKMCDWIDNSQENFIKHKEFLQNVIYCYENLFPTNPLFQGNNILNTLFDQLPKHSSLFTLIFESHNIKLDANKSKEEVYEEFIKHIGDIIE